MGISENPVPMTGFSPLNERRCCLLPESQRANRQRWLIYFFGFFELAFVGRWVKAEPASFFTSASVAFPVFRARAAIFPTCFDVSSFLAICLSKVKRTSRMLNSYMRISEILTSKPLSLAQARANALSDQAKRLRDQAKQERAQQRLRKAQADLTKVRAATAPSIAV